MADRSAGYNVFRKYKGVLESYVDKKFNEVVDGFYNEEILTEQQKTDAHDASKKRSERIANLKKIIREMCQESDTKFEAILRAFRSIEGVDVRKITTDFETEKKKSASKPKPKSSERASKTMHSSPIRVQEDSQPAPKRGGITNPPSFIDHFPRSGDHLSTIPGSPSLNTSRDNEDDDQPPIDTEVVPEQENGAVQQETQTRRPSRVSRPHSMIENETDDAKKQIEELIHSIGEETHTSEELNAKVTMLQAKHKKLVAFYDKKDEQYNRLQTESRHSSLHFTAKIGSLESDLQGMQDEWDYEKQCTDEEIKSLGDSWQEESFRNVLKQEEVEDLCQQLKEKKANIEKLTHELQTEKQDVRKINNKLRTVFATERNETLNAIGRKLSSCVSAETQEEADKLFQDVELFLIRLKGRPCTTGGARSIRQ